MRAPTQQFVEKWRPKVETVTNARHKGMLKVILGEMLEHKRLFDQAAAGNDRPASARRSRSTSRSGDVMRPAALE